jgi:transcriptional regulator with XRE-family HTH domain
MRKITVKEITRKRLFDDLSYEQIGRELGVTKQYLSFICNKKKNVPEKIHEELYLEFLSNQDNYTDNEKIRIKRKLLKLRLEDVAKHVGTFAPVVWRIEKGFLKNSIFINRIKDYLEV